MINQRGLSEGLWEPQWKNSLVGIQGIDTKRSYLHWAACPLGLCLAAYTEKNLNNHSLIKIEVFISCKRSPALDSIQLVIEFHDVISISLVLLSFSFIVLRMQLLPTSVPYGLNMAAGTPDSSFKFQARREKEQIWYYLLGASLEILPNKLSISLAIQSAEEIEPPSVTRRNGRWDIG